MLYHWMPDWGKVENYYCTTSGWQNYPVEPDTCFTDIGLKGYNGSDEIIIVPLRELPRESAKIEIAEYIQRAGGRRVYISELAEELRLDIELIMEIVDELESETRE